jgi:hypothetical protein
MRRKRKRYFEREILGAARNIEHGAALVRSGQAGSRPSHNQSSRATHSAHCRQQRQLPKRRARGMMIGPRHAVEEIAHPWEGGHSEASAALVAAWEGRALWKLLREAPTSPYVFMSERRAPLSAAGYQRMVARAGVAAKFTFPVHSHMLRHACGFKLANDGHDTRTIQAFLGHRSIMSTVRYTALTPNRFKNFWKD